MSNIHVQSLEEIMSQMELIKSEINECKPFSITNTETLELIENLLSHVKTITKELQTVKRVSKALFKEGLIP